MNSHNCMRLCRILIGNASPVRSYCCITSTRLKVHSVLFYAKMDLHSERGDTGQKNNLREEKSPYLLQHVNNPVDWYPWGEKAFLKAKNENKLIFLSVGYSTCHWCHVMEKESFMNHDIAAVMNEHFVNVKVDREERPDVDKLYMTFVQAISGGGGWPMSVWLTPDLKPVYGGTYFPPDNRYYGRKGFMSILKLLALQWETSQKDIIESGSSIIKALQENATIGRSTTAEFQTHIPEPECVQICFSQLAKSYEPKYGGFGNSPKFPQPVNLDFLLDYSTLKGASDSEEALKMCVHTLDKMSLGGMHDHVSQGFARYSTDGEWHVPHFEKMLYDQAQLCVTYSIAFAITNKAEYQDIVDDILTYVSRDLSHPSGGCYSAEDADSFPTDSSVDKKEGAFCVWTEEEIDVHLKDIPSKSPDLVPAAVFKHHFDVRPEGNVNPAKDPHNELKNQNVLIIRGSMEETAKCFNSTVEDVQEIITLCLQKLHIVRQSRPRPHRDTKIIASWNGMMLSAYSIAAQFTGREHYKEKALTIKNFLQKHLCLPSGEVVRSVYVDDQGTICQISPPISGFCDDYATIIRGLLDLYECCLDSSFITWANDLQVKQNELFWDAEDGGYFFSTDRDQSIVVRMKEDQDGAEPCSNSVSVSNLMRLSYYMGNDDYRDKAGMILAAFSERLNKVPIVLPKMVSGFLWYSRPPCMIIVTGDLRSDGCKQLLKTIYSKYIPRRVLVYADNDPHSSLYQNMKNLQHLNCEAGVSQVYVCSDLSCSLPVTTSEELETRLSTVN